MDVLVRTCCEFFNAPLKNLKNVLFKIEVCPCTCKMIFLIVAFAKNNVIGKDGKISWNIDVAATIVTATSWLPLLDSNQRPPD